MNRYELEQLVDLLLAFYESDAAAEVRPAIAEVRQVTMDAYLRETVKAARDAGA